MKKAKKAVSALLTLALSAGIMLPAAAPALAYSDNRVDKVVNVDEDFKGAASTLTISEDDDYSADFIAGESFTLTLPSGVDWDATSLGVYFTPAGGARADLIASGDAVISNDQTLDITIPSNVVNTAGTKDKFEIKLGVEIDGAEGDIKVAVDPLDSGVSGGEYLFARVQSGDTIVKAMDVETVGDGNVTGGTIRIEETALGSIGYGQETVTLKLPNDFEWATTMAASDITFSGGFLGSTLNVADVTGQGTRTLTIKFTPPGDGSTTFRSQRGIVNIAPKFKATKDADYGDVEINVSGTDIDDADVVVAKYSDFGVDFTIDGVEELIAGKFDQDTDVITIEESVPGTFIANRDVTIELPSWVKVTGLQNKKASGGGISDADVVIDTIDGDDNEITFHLTKQSTSTTAKIEFKLDLSIEGNHANEDIKAKLYSKNAGVDETELVIAKAVGLVKAETVEKQIKIGVQSQEVSDIIITELKDENFNEANGKKQVKVDLPEGVKFSTTPKVEVIEGNLEIDEDSIDTKTNADTGTEDGTLVFDIDSQSSKASKIKISGIKLTVDRTVAEGTVWAKIGGNALIENAKSASGWLNNASDPATGAGANRLDAGEFDTGTAAKVSLARVVTPAPEAGTAVFSIGSTIYTAGGVTKVMDAAPYIKDSRTYVPVRFLALALGVAEEDIAFENGVVTLTKGDTVLKLTIGSKELDKNGTMTTMDVAPEVVNGRTMLPARFVAEGFGALVGYANGQVVITQ